MKAKDNAVTPATAAELYNRVYTDALKLKGMALAGDDEAKEKLLLLNDQLSRASEHL